MKLLFVTTLLIALGSAQTANCQDDPDGVLQASEMSCASLLNLAICGDTLGSWNTNELCPQSCNLCDQQAADPSVVENEPVDIVADEPTPSDSGEGAGEPDVPYQYDCGEGYVYCDENMQRAGVNCALGSCTRRIPSSPSYTNQQPSSGSPNTNEDYQCSSGRGQYGRGQKQHHIRSQQECQARCNMDTSCVGFDFNNPRKGQKVMCRTYGVNTPRYGSSGKTDWLYCTRHASSLILQKPQPQTKEAESNQSLFAISALSFMFGGFVFLFLYTLYVNTSTTRAQKRTKSIHLLQETGSQNI